jgi:hypothetical protein
VKALRTPVLLMLAVGLADGLPGCNNDEFFQAFPLFEVGTERIEFGAVAVGDVVSQDLVFQNSGRGDLIVQAAVQNAPEVFTAQVLDARVAPGTQGRIEIFFAPAEVRHYPDVLVLTSNDRDHPSVEVILSGDGYRRGEIQVEPTLIDFGLVNAGDVGLGQVFIRNLGNGDLVLKEIALGEGTSPDFQILSSTNPDKPLAAGATAALSLAYRPGGASLPPEPGALWVRAADPFQPETEVTLLARLNRAPVANAGSDLQVDPLDPVVLDGSSSYDPDGDHPLRYAWTLVRVPEGSAASLGAADTATATFVPELVGVYEAELWVTDSTGLGSLMSDRVLVTALPAERLLVELVWDSPVADLDLHLLAPGGLPNGALDCYWGNREPEWGNPGTADDPALLRDDLMGFGPETVAYQEPLDGTYRLLVDYYAAHTPSGREPTTATLRVFVDGFLAAEIAKRLDSQGESWGVGAVRWPEGTVEPGE